MKTRCAKNVLMAFLCIVAFAGTACAGQIVMWSQPFGEEADDAMAAAIKEWNEKNPEMPVVLETRGNDDHKVALRVAASGQSGPDLYQMWGGLGLGGEYVNSGLSTALDKEYEQYKWDDRLLISAISDSKKYKNERHGVPFKMAVQGLYYNKALFEKAGIAKEPETYEELLDACEKLKAIKVAPITFGGSVNWHLMRLMDVLLEKNAGAAEHDSLIAMQTSWKDNANVIKSFEDLKFWSDNYILRPYMGMGFDQSCNLFFIGRAAMMLDSDALVPRIAVNADIDNFGVFPFPMGTERLYFYSELFYINDHSKVKDEAVKFLDYFISDETQQKMLGKLSMVSVNKNVDYSGQTNELEKEWRDMYTMHEATFPNGDQGFPLDVTLEYFRVINAVASDKLAPADAAAELQKFIDNRQ